MDQSISKNTKKNRITARDIALIGMMIAVIEVSKFALAQVPNVELTTFWIIIFTLYLGKRIFYVIPAFILIEGAVYGFHLWWIMYLYVWPLLALLTFIFRKQKSVWFWSILSGVFGLMFGFLCSFTYVVIGIVEGGIRNGLYAGFAYWVAGIPFDIPHCIGNFVIMLVLYIPIRTAMKKCESILL